MKSNGSLPPKHATLTNCEQKKAMALPVVWSRAIYNVNYCRKLTYCYHNSAISYFVHYFNSRFLQSEYLRIYHLSLQNIG